MYVTYIALPDKTEIRAEREMNFPHEGIISGTTEFRLGHAWPLLRCNAAQIVECGILEPVGL